MKLEALRQLFAYDAWANREVMAAAKASRDFPDAALRLVNHLLSAHRLWLERLKGERQSLAVWPELSLSDCEALSTQMAQTWDDYLSPLDDSRLDAICSYSNSKGERFTNRVEDILTHVILHSAYHRGQIASRMRDAGLTPAYTDYIHAVRQGFIE